MDRILKLKETEIAVPAMTDYLAVGNTADNVNSHTYVYEPNKSLHQVRGRLTSYESKLKICTLATT